MNVVYDLCLLEGCHYLGSMDIINLAVTSIALSNQLIITLYQLVHPKGWVRVKLTTGSIPLDPRSRCRPPVSPPNRYSLIARCHGAPCVGFTPLSPLVVERKNFFINDPSNLVKCPLH